MMQSETKKSSDKVKVYPKDYVPRLRQLYDEKVSKELAKKLEIKNVQSIPKFDKVVLNMGVGEASQDRKHIEIAQEELSLIAGQKAIKTYAKFAEAAFKIREGMAIGCKVTIRGYRMYDFLDRLVTIALPRVRDFRGLNRRSFDSNGNYSFGLKEQIVFPEVNYDKTDKIRGMDVTICTTSDNDEWALALLQAFNFPFEETQEEQKAREESERTKT